MNNISRFVSIAALCLPLVGCYETHPPVTSASVTRWQHGMPLGTAQQLTSAQAAKLSAWLQNHRWGWYPIMATDTPGTLVSLTHSDGTVSSVNLIQRILIVGQSQRGLTESESQELHSIINTQNGS